MESNKNINKMSLREFFIISRWTFVLLFQISKPATILYLIFNVLDKLSPVFNAIIFAKALDKVISILSTESPDFSQIIPYLGLMIGFMLLNTLFSYLRTITGDYTFHKSKPILNRVLYLKLKDLGIQNLENPEVNNQIIRVKDTIGTIRDHVDNVVLLISNIVNIITSAIVVFTLVPWLVIPVMPIALIYLLFDRKYRQVLYNYIYRNTENARKADTYAQDLTDSKKLEEITINNAFNFIDKKYKTFWDKYTNELTSIIRKRVSGLYTNQFLYDIITAFGYVFVFTRVIEKVMTIGNATLAVRSLQLMQDSITDTVLVFNKTYEYSIKLRDAYDLFKTTTKIPDGNIQMPKAVEGPEIHIENLEFTYPNAKSPVYTNLNIKISKGEKIAIVGHNGAGKTTLVKLLARFYKPQNGSIIVNGVNINEYQAESYYKNMGILFQDYNTYPQLNVTENVFIGRTECSLDEDLIDESISKAEATDFVEKLHEKLNTTLSEKFENGIRLSTGQWQKLAIARFFYRNPSLVIFDEPTSAIDAVSEERIFNNIYHFFEGKTVIIISHRFSTVRNADRILVIDHGQLVEEGTHNELVKKNGVYANAYNIQAKGYKNEEDQQV